MSKKIIALVLAVLVAALGFVLVGCGDNKKTDSDLEYVKGKNELVIGYTLFAPMDYLDDNNELTGFEIEFGKAVCEKLGVTPKFVEIDWTKKESELASKNIDCVWNGMTITDERLQTMSISTPYMANKQVLLVKKENAEKYLKAEDMKGMNLVAEAESAGEEVAQTNEIFKDAKYTPVAAQKDALKDVKAGIADGCVVDYVLSIGMIGEGTSFEDLVVVDSLSFADEQYGIAFRKDSDITAKVNEAITELVNSGELAQIAGKYKLAEQIIAK